MRITAAVFIGGAIIVSALYFRGYEPVGQGAVVVAHDNELRKAIEARDENGNGVPDWEEELNTKTLKTLESIPEIETSDEPVGEPETLTEEFARSFFESYARGNLSGALNPENQQRFLEQSVSSLERDTRDELYRKSDVTTIPDSPTTIREYGNHIAEIVQRYAVETEDPLYTLERALQAGDESELESLDELIVAYDNAITAFQKLAVPQTFAKRHLDVLNVSSAVRNDVAAMREAFSDPLYTLVRTKRYTEDVEAMIAVFVGIYTVLEREGIHYADDEAGSFGSFYLEL